MTNDETRSIEIETHVDANPEDVWTSLTTGDGLKRWFPLDARVEPEVGGQVWLSWGPGCEGEAPIHIWDEPRRFGWTESYGEDEQGRPIRVAIDFHIEGREGSTVVRLVQSGLSASSDWDEMYDALKDGWTYFLFNLAYHFEVHGGQDRTLVWKRHPIALSRDEVWHRLTEGGLVGGDLALDGEHEAKTVSRRDRYHFAATLPALNDSVWFVEVEGAHVGFWLSVYDDDGLEPDGLQSTLEHRVTEVLGA
ncbi:MAG: SRPBCC domain-containing protein [Gemmatimonadetes bacterium]|nr:SRPBCC domain-containing protein [Gemmatimonadota bacterium]NNF14582.1 SRPBCC domain-containing protein [Gemmatimonadota bacterium]NNL30813.1 SRPBCC domain-containing protein [Gemmatimonadota bacterium]